MTRSHSWARALTESYRTELRAEKPHRARVIVQHDVERYRRIAAAFAGTAPAMPAAAAARLWWRRRVEGKALSSCGWPRHRSPSPAVRTTSPGR